MGKNIRSSSSPKALATSFPMPPLADAMDAVRLSVDRFCLLAGVEALAGLCQVNWIHSKISVNCDGCFTQFQWLSLVEKCRKQPTIS